MKFTNTASRNIPLVPFLRRMAEINDVQINVLMIENGWDETTVDYELKGEELNVQNFRESVARSLQEYADRRV